MVNNLLSLCFYNSSYQFAKHLEKQFIEGKLTTENYHSVCRINR
ncbi:hypothetical protein XBKB1_1710005 [Xenorhabdus bovienii str. kraussei Becker Underwood]|uniref:Uncharacterized protein n=1 Tax=Xenorhabdus bovienii str. kraussei Becker Underwood TaxID=1398204 RepID=A0A077PRF6_XENBV|nr:hypothetical protein XBKB1_1710005 [Xenorhabdus bovienii str. kraussei Becker Underwood]